MSSTNEIARKVFIRVAASQGVYNLSPEGLDIAMSCPFIDATEIGLKLALACEIAAQAEDTIEAGGRYTAKVVTPSYTSRDLYTRVRLIFEEGGLEALREDIQKFPKAFKQLEKDASEHYSTAFKEFVYGGVIPTKDRIVSRIFSYVKNAYEVLLMSFPDFNYMIGGVEVLARGILRDLDLVFDDDQLFVDGHRQRGEDPFKATISLEGDAFYEEDPLRMDESRLAPKASYPAQSFLATKGRLVFVKAFLGSQDLSEINLNLQELNGALNHPDERVRAEAQEWVSSSEGMKFLYTYVINDRQSASREVKAAARGFIKRIYKNYDDATFGERDAREAAKFFGKDTKMLLQKCWNKSPLKQSFGAFKVSDRMLDMMLRVICKRLNPLGTPKSSFERLNPTIITDAVTVIMIHTALSNMGVQNRPDFRQLLKL